MKRHPAVAGLSARLAFITALLAVACAVHAADWKPERQVEFIVPTGPGSGVDNTFRTIQAVIQGRKIVDAPIIVMNRAGGGYAVALNYLAQAPGDGHKLMVQTSTPITAYITGQLKENYFEFTPVANLISEPIAFMVRADSPFRNAQDLVARLKSNPESVSIALSAARGNAYHIASALIARTAGVDIKRLKVVVFNSSGEGVTAMLGGHVDVLSVTPANFIPLVQSQKARIIGVASTDRLTGPLAASPTLREQGIDVVFDVPRGVIGPKGLAPDRIRYWEGVFGTMVKTPEWKQALDKFQWDPDFRGSADMGRELRRQHDILKEVLTELGMVGAK
jgi:putative tricarboxylic transport membrane protein